MSVKMAIEETGFCGSGGGPQAEPNLPLPVLALLPKPPNPVLEELLLLLEPKPPNPPLPPKDILNADRYANATGGGEGENATTAAGGLLVSARWRD